MKNTVWLLLTVLVMLHHDVWFWSDPTLVAGWLPVGLAYHIVLSIVAAGFWLFVVRCVWPQNLVTSHSQPSSRNDDSSSEAPQS